MAPIVPLWNLFLLYLLFSQISAYSNLDFQGKRKVKQSKNRNANRKDRLDESSGAVPSGSARFSAYDDRAKGRYGRYGRYHRLGWVTGKLGHKRAKSCPQRNKRKVMETGGLRQRQILSQYNWRCPVLYLAVGQDVQSAVLVTVGLPAPCASLPVSAARLFPSPSLVSPSLSPSRLLPSDNAILHVSHSSGCPPLPVSSAHPFI